MINDSQNEKRGTVDFEVWASNAKTTRASTTTTASPTAATATSTFSMKNRSLEFLEENTFLDNEPPPPLYRALVVDDSTSNRKMLVRLLRDKCSVITEAADGVEAVDIIKTAIKADRDRSRGSIAISNITTPTGSFCLQPNYDAVLMDFIMPNMEGPEAARGMRELGYTGLIIGITGNALKADKDRFISCGANMVLTKPVNVAELEIALNLIVANRM